MDSTTMLDMLTSVLSGPVAGMLARRFGTDEATIKKAIAMALPLIISALARNASSPKGASALAGALARDHDGSLLDDVAGFVVGGDTGTGDAILKHVLGSRRAAAEAGISQQSGLDPAAVSQLLAMLAPLVLGYLGRQQRTQQLDPGSLGDMLGKEQANVQQQAPDALGGLLDVLLDKNQDGNVKDDAARIGVGMLRKWLTGRKK
jgi:hypothetical protein